MFFFAVVAFLRVAVVRFFVTVFEVAVLRVAVFALFWAMDGETSVTKHSNMMSKRCIVLDLIIIT